MKYQCSDCIYSYDPQKGDLKYGISVTDACMDWETTEKSIIEMASKIESVLNGRRGKI